MDAADADIEAVFRYHAAHGTTSLCPTTATAPLDEILTSLEAIARYRNGLQAFGRALGAHIEGPYLAMTKRGCHLPQFVHNPEEREWRKILERGPDCFHDSGSRTPRSAGVGGGIAPARRKRQRGAQRSVVSGNGRGGGLGYATCDASLLRDDRCHEQPLARHAEPAQRRHRGSSLSR